MDLLGFYLYMNIELMIQLSIIPKMFYVKSQTTFHFFVIVHFGRKPFSLLIIYT